MVGVLISIWSGGSWSVVCGQWLVGGLWFCITPGWTTRKATLKIKIFLYPHKTRKILEQSDAPKSIKVIIAFLQVKFVQPKDPLAVSE